jgi:hypothetical protein
MMFLKRKKECKEKLNKSKTKRKDKKTTKLLEQDAKIPNKILAIKSQVQWYTPAIPVLRRLKQENGEFSACLSYIVSCRIF